MRKYLLLLIPILLLSCTSEKFEFTLDVKAKVIGSTNDHIGIQYEIYGKPLFQDVYIPTYAELAYYAKMKEIPLTVLVEGDDYDGSDRVFITLTHNGSLFGDKREKYKRISMYDFIPLDLKIPGFTWYMFNDEEYSDGISAQGLREKLHESGDDPPEIKATVTIEKKGGDEDL